MLTTDLTPELRSHAQGDETGRGIGIALLTVAAVTPTLDERGEPGDR